MSDAIDLDETYLYLEGNRAEVIPGGAPFWAELLGGGPQSAGVRRVAEGHGWLMSRYQMTTSPDHWECHPLGDEILVLPAGRVDVVFADGDGTRTVALADGDTCVVPRGVWHRQVVHAPSTLIAITCGEGTEHRPID